MAFGDTDYDRLLKDAWDKFCDDLKRSADDLFRDPIRISSVHERAEAFRYLTQAVAQGFLWHVENEPMALHPWLLGLFSPIKKQAGDKSMSRDYGAYVDGRHDYRILGDRGTSRWIALTAVRLPDVADPLSSSARWNEPWALVLDSEPLLGTEIIVEADGTFEIACSKVRPPLAKNWLRITPETNHLRVRQLFDDWNREEPMSIRIERIGGEPGSAPPPLLHPDQMAFALRKAGSFVLKSTEAWGPPPLESRSENQMANMPVPESRIGGIDANPGGVMAVTWWAVAPDEALLLEFKPVPSLMWSIELENVWWVTADYRWRLVEVTDEQAVVDDDGVCRVVVAHQDPGLPNWLDTATFGEGWVRYRGMLSDGMRGPDWNSRVVKLDELLGALPPNVKRIGAADRKQQIALRAAGVRKRYRD